ncbi:MAG TPA: dipeptide epimerase [Steroidobacteraceae bacterium]|nr:dipeptide epimerase [Steroidobacteraceae bacterium]
MQLAVEELPLKVPFRISGYTFTQIPALFVRLSGAGAEGCGEAEGVYYFDDVPVRMAAQVESQRAAIEAGITREELRQLMPAGGARNAVDCALWDLEAKRAGQPVWKLAGLEHVVPLTTMFTLGADHPAAVAMGALSRANATALKLKLSGELDIDIERVRAVRAARPDVWLGVDANQGYTLDSLERLLPVLSEARVLLLEQPLARGCEANLDHLDCPIPIAADESVQSLADVDGLLGRFDVVNIKLDKCGGLTEALLMIEHARRIGLKVMVGNMVGTSIAMAPAFVAGQLCDFVDLDGPTFLSADRSPGVVFKDGTVWCPPELWG